MDLSTTSHRLGFIAALVVIAGIAVAFFMTNDTESDATILAVEQSSARSETAPAEAAQSAAAPQSAASAKGIASGAVFETNRGDIEVKFYAAEAPKTVESFSRLAQAGFYNGTTFHRVIPNFMIQGGDPLTKDEAERNRWGTGGPGFQFEDEINAVSLGLSSASIAGLESEGYRYRTDIRSKKLVRGTLAMANSGPNTNGSQFFIVTAQSTPWLDGRHTAFGEVIRGMDVVDVISSVATTKPGDVPKAPIIVESIILK